MVLAVNNLLASAGDVRHGFDPWVEKIPWKRKWQPTPVFLPGESHRGDLWTTVHRVAESDATEAILHSAFIHLLNVLNIIKLLFTICF